MQFLIVSDLHANWSALRAVLSDATGKYDRIVCCGDIVGYNPNPGRVLEWARTNCESIVRGNHDKVVCGLEDLDWFNEVAQTAARWTTEQLQEEQLQFLRDLTQGPLVLDHFELFHGSPVDEDEYLTEPSGALPCFDSLSLPLAFFGHTHLQGGFFSRRGRVGQLPTVKPGERERVFELEPDTLFMVNGGSVGQPRDHDPRAAYALFDPDQKTVTLRRVEYPIETTADEILRAGLPNALAARLFHGR